MRKRKPERKERGKLWGRNSFSIAKFMSCIHWQNRVENNNENCQKAAAAAPKEKLSWLDLSRSQWVVAEGTGECTETGVLPVVYSGRSQGITKLQFGILSVFRQVTAAKSGRKLAKYWLWPFCQQVSLSSRRRRESSRRCIIFKCNLAREEHIKTGNHEEWQL